ncbi:hypothetical protein QTP70_007358, partial [Hemibagrus guttatus]
AITLTLRHKQMCQPLKSALVNVSAGSLDLHRANRRFAICCDRCCWSPGVDNAPCHKTEMVQEWFDEHNNQFEVLTWPPNSTDLNPIQHLWNVLDKQIPQHTFRDLVESSGSLAVSCKASPSEVRQSGTQFPGKVTSPLTLGL